MKQWFHPDCMFETFVRARAATKKIEDPDDLEGFSDLEQADKDIILKLIKGNDSYIVHELNLIMGKYNFSEMSNSKNI